MDVDDGRTRSVVAARLGWAPTAGGDRAVGCVATDAVACSDAVVGSDAVRDEVMVEAPLEVHLDGELVATTMRTPGNDFELALGLLWSEGRIAGPQVTLRRCPERGSPLSSPEDVLCVEHPAGEIGRGRNGSSAGAGEPAAGPRLGLTASSCGICGVEQMERLVAGLDPLKASEVHPAALLRVVDDLERRDSAGQGLFERTGGAHAAGALTADGSVILVREDIGRHNAVDKVVGALLEQGSLPALLAGVPVAVANQDGPHQDGPDQDGPGGPLAHPALLWVSGRASFEIVQKAWAAGIAVVISVGAVSALAIELAERANISLVGFARAGRATLYSGALRQEVQGSEVQGSEVQGSEAQGLEAQ
ncbi:MAG: formate dehydrogenase accessory sulfurtransferase FdhD [Microthrixaceae bacterium]